eukprot:257909-Rhodomonas_salina.1
MHPCGPADMDSTTGLMLLVDPPPPLPLFLSFFQCLCLSVSLAFSPSPPLSLASRIDIRAWALVMATTTTTTKMTLLRCADVEKPPLARLDKSVQRHAIHRMAKLELAFTIFAFAIYPWSMWVLQFSSFSVGSLSKA